MGHLRASVPSPELHLTHKVWAYVGAHTYNLSLRSDSALCPGQLLFVTRNSEEKASSAASPGYVPPLVPRTLTLTSAKLKVSSSPLECSVGIRHCSERVQWVPFLPLKCSMGQRPALKAEVTSSELALRPAGPGCPSVCLSGSSLGFCPLKCRDLRYPPVGRHL